MLLGSTARCIIFITACWSTSWRCHNSCWCLQSKMYEPQTSVKTYTGIQRQCDNDTHVSSNAKCYTSCFIVAEVLAPTIPSLMFNLTASEYDNMYLTKISYTTGKI